MFFGLDGFGWFVKNEVRIGVWVDLWVLNCIGLVYVCVCVGIGWSFYEYWCVIVVELRDSDWG